jgi:3-oxoacid CoA-transferase subunit B
LDLISAGKGFCTLALGASLFDQQISFTMMRGGHLTHAILGALEVAENGDFANWKVPGEAVPGVVAQWIWPLDLPIFMWL